MQTHDDAPLAHLGAEDARTVHRAGARFTADLLGTAGGRFMGHSRRVEEEADAT